MVKRLRYGATLLLTIVFLYSTAQNNDCIKGIALEKLEKEIVLKLTLAYFEDYKVDKKKLSDTEQKGLDAYKKLISKNIDSLNYPDDILSFLKIKSNGWSGSGVTVFNGYYESMQKAKENDIFCREEMFKTKKITSTKHLDSIFNNFVEQANIINWKAEPEPVENIKEDETQTQKPPISKDKKFLAEWIYWIIIGVLIVLIFFFYRFAKKTDSEFERLERRYERLKSDNIYKINNLEQQLNQKSKDIKSVKEKNEELKSKSVLKDKSTNKEDKLSIEPENKTLEQEYIKELFLPAPNDEGKFKVLKAKDSKSSFSLYKITLNKDKKSGSLWIVENEDMFELAFNSPDKYLEKACSYSNAREKHHKSIETIKSGKVILDGDDWLIKEKLTIKFI
jgi:hypothetical protein